MRYLGVGVVVTSGLLGVLAAASPPSAWARRPARAGPVEVRALRAKLRSADPKVRQEALSTLQSFFDSKVETVRALAPMVRHLVAKDPSCRVRVEALRVLILRGKQLRMSPHRAILRALADACPIAQARGAGWMVALPFGARAKVVRRLVSLARSSPYYHVQCSALLALGKLRAKQAEKLMARALTVGAGTGLRGGRTSYQLQPRTMPQCAVQALERLRAPKTNASQSLVNRRDALAKKLRSKLPPKERKRILLEYWRLHVEVIRRSIRQPPPVTVDQVRRWRNRLSKRGLVRPSPPALCLRSDSCPVGQACLHMSCVPNARALKAYRVYRQRRPLGRRKARRAWSNVEDPLAVRMGLGMGAVSWLGGLARRRPRARVSGRARHHWELRKRALRLWMQNRCPESIRLARQAYQLKPSTFVANLIGFCACQLGNAVLARWAYRRVHRVHRKQLGSFCQRKGVRVP
jgi:hypothetical protein